VSPHRESIIFNDISYRSHESLRAGKLVIDEAGQPCINRMIINGTNETYLRVQKFVTPII